MKADKKIITNIQGICPVCGNGVVYLDIVDAEDAGAYKLWKCHGCRCTGKEYCEFVDHYDVYEADGETRVDNEDATYRIKRERLIQLLSSAISCLHEVTGEDESYETLYDLANDIGITEEEYHFIMDYQADVTNAISNIKNIEIIIERNEFKDFLINEIDALIANSITIAKSKNYDSDGLKMVVDYDDDHYSIRVEDFDTSDIDFEHLYEAEIEQAEKLYDKILSVLARHIKPCPAQTRTKDLAVKIPYGNLTVNKYDLPEYSGFDVYIEDEIVAAIEFDKENGLRVFAYGNLTDDDPTHIIKIENIEMQLALNDNDGNPYLDYNKLPPLSQVPDENEFEDDNNEE